MNDNIENISNMQQLEQQAGGEALSNANKPPENFMERFNQEKDADFTDISLGGKHFIVKAPDRSTDSGLILSEKQQKELQNVQETPGFQDDVRVELASDKCEFVNQGDMILLSPHVNTLEIELPAKGEEPENLEEDEEGDVVLYLMIHEDYVLMKKSG